MAACFGGRTLSGWASLVPAWAVQYFAVYNNQLIANGAAWDGTTWKPLGAVSIRPNLNLPYPSDVAVGPMVVYNGELFAGGGVMTFGDKASAYARYSLNDTDADGDGAPDCQDNCPALANADQADCDGDGKGNALQSRMARAWIATAMGFPTTANSLCPNCSSPARTRIRSFSSMGFSAATVRV